MRRREFSLNRQFARLQFWWWVWPDVEPGGRNESSLLPLISQNSSAEKRSKTLVAQVGRRQRRNVARNQIPYIRDIWCEDSKDIDTELDSYLVAGCWFVALIMWSRPMKLWHRSLYRAFVVHGLLVDVFRSKVVKVWEKGDQKKMSHGQCRVWWCDSYVRHMEWSSWKQQIGSFGSR